MIKQSILKGLLAAVLSITIATIFGSSATYAEAVTTRGLFTDGSDVRWEWEKIIDVDNTEEPEQVSIMFYDKPAATTTIVVPSLSDVITAASASESLNTYYVRSADEESQAANYTEADQAKRTSTADVTVLDMTNTSKVQIMGVKPIINPETEVELIFGENMVIGDDIDINVSFTIERCVEAQQDPNYGRRYNCVRTEPEVHESMQSVIPDWNTLTPFEKTRYQPSEDTMMILSQCTKIDSYTLTAYSNIEAHCYATGASSSVAIRGVFSGYKLNITSLENVKYLGWYAFADSVFNENSRSVTIKDYQTAGEGVFQNTNINEVAFEGTDVYPAMFRDCPDLTAEHISFGNVETIGYNAFENTNLGFLDLSNTSIVEVLDYAFKNAGLATIDFGNIQIIKSYAFSENNLTELFLPKTINELEGGAFYGNENLKKATVAYDTLTSGTRTPFYVVLNYLAYGNHNFSTPHQAAKLEELNILAPYQDDEQVKATHIAYNDYRNDQIIISLYNSRFSTTGHEAVYWAEDNYAHIEEYKNIVAPNYFSMLPNLKSITVGDGIEYLGNGAFQIPGSGSTSWAEVTSGWSRNMDALTSVVLPESLKGVGTLAMRSTFNEDFTMNLPTGLEFIGYAAFSQLYFLDEDVDFPNLRFLGDYAFYSTSVRNVVLHDNLEYVGPGVFNDCPGLRNITFDYDVFNSEKFNWWLEGSTASSNYRNLFGARYGGLYYDHRSILQEYGFEFAEGSDWYDNKYGTITFTEKSIASPPVLCEASRRSCANSSINFFDGFHGDLIDASEAKWEYIPEYMFERVDLNEIRLPGTIKRIAAYAFTDAGITEEIVLPEGLEIIEDFAFSQHYTWYLHKKESFKITSLPTSLKKIGTEAFYLDRRLEIDNFEFRDLETIGNSAFVGATIHNITLSDNMKQIGVGAFWFVYGIENLTIDLDLFNENEVSSGNITVMTHGDANGGTRPYLDTSNYFNTARYLGLYFMYDEPYYQPSDKYGIAHYTTRPWSEQGDTTHQFGDVVFTEKSITAPVSIPVGTPAGSFFRFFANKIDISRTGWNVIPRGSFIEAVTDEILLPESLESIEEAAFFYAKITNELILPDGIKTIGRGAFGNSPRASRLLSNYCYSSPGCEDRGIIITKLPESLETIYEGAFYYDYNLSLDFDLPNIKQIGQSAFQGTALKSVTLHDTITAPLFSGTFANIPTLESIVIDYDYFGINTEEEAAIAASWDWNNNPYAPDFKYTWPSVADFFGVFNTTPYDKYPSKGVYYEVGEVEIKPYASVTFTEKAVTEPVNYSSVVSWSEGFAKLEYEKLDLSKTGWKQFTVPYIFQNAKFNELLLPEGLETITQGAFYGAEIEKPLVVPSSVKVIGDNAFELAKVTFTDSLSEGLTTIGTSAFYGTQVSGDLVIPSTVTSIGWSAFNAGDTDTNYGTVTVKPALTYDSTDSQAIFQLFWNAKMDKLVIESPMLPVLAATGDNPILPHEVQYETVIDGNTETVTITPTLREDGEPEFHSMTMREVEIKNLPVITANAFEECANLEKVSFANHDALISIERYAFNNDTKLKSFVFGDGLVGKEVSLGLLAFSNTAIETIGDHNTDFDLTAANFNANSTYAFSNLPALKSVMVPNNFSNATIPAFTFADDPELEDAVISYQLTNIYNGAFMGDTKLAKLFVWGNTDIEESAEFINATGSLTIPEQTTIFAYSDAPAETYANAESRDNYEGKFYALDEVLYLTTNKTYVVLEQDEEGNNVDFNKEGLKLYALRRDGVILQSDNWQEYTTAYSRNNVPAEEGTITFEEGRGALGSDEADIAGQVYDAEKPFNTISLANQNYVNVNFAFIQMPSSNNPLVLINYPDGYTGNIRTAALASMTKAEEEEYLRRLEEELEVPNTGVFGTIVGVATSTVSIATVVVLSGIYVFSKRRK